MSIKICHMTSVHDSYDVRIFQKECLSLSKNSDFDIYLVAPGESRLESGVQVFGVGKRPASRLKRIFLFSRIVYQKALEINFENFFAKPIYSDHPISIIGSIYYTNNWPNTGYLGDGFMNFGYVGMLVFSIIFAGILILFDSLSNTKGKSMITSAYMVLFMLSFNNIALLTNLLFGGMLFYLLLIFLYKDNITFDNYCDSGKI